MLSIELKLGQALKKCVILQCGVAVRKRDNEMLEDLQFFHELVLNEWAMKVSLIALRTLSDNKFNKVEIMLVNNKCNEAAKMKIEQYQSRARWEEVRLKEVSSSLQPLELQLYKR